MSNAEKRFVAALILAALACGAFFIMGAMAGVEPMAVGMASTTVLFLTLGVAWGAMELGAATWRLLAGLPLGNAPRQDGEGL